MNPYQVKVLEFMSSDVGAEPDEKACYLSELVHNDVPGLPGTTFFGGARGRTSTVSKGHAQRWLDEWIKRGELCQRGQDLAVEHLDLEVSPKTVEISFQVTATVTPTDATDTPSDVASAVAHGLVDEVSYAYIGGYEIEDFRFDASTLGVKKVE